MNRSRKNNMGTKPSPSMMMTTNTNNNNNNLSGSPEMNARSSRRQQRVQNFKNMPSIITPANNGLKGLMLNQNSTFEITPRANNATMATQLNIPDDIKEKLNRWREDRQKRQMMVSGDMNNDTVDYQSTQQPHKQPHQPNHISQELRQPNAKISSPPSRSPPQPSPTQPSPPQPSQTQLSENDHQELNKVTQNLDGYHEFMSTGGKLPLELLDNKNFSDSFSSPPSQPQTKQANPTSSSPPTALQSLFDTTGQEILKGMVEVEVKKVLDQLKKERPELVTQTDLINQINLKNRKVEDSLQQFNIHNQRLKDTVDQLSISIKAVQTNIDNVKHETGGGGGLTEDVMRSWVLHFFNEQIGNLKKDFQEEYYKTNEKINQLSGGKSNELKIIENNVKLLETKLQNTLQNIFESVCFVYGTVVEKVSIYTLQDLKSTVIASINPGEEILLNYPIIKDGNDRWMKARVVDHESAQLAEGYIPIFLNNLVLLNNFHL